MNDYMTEGSLELEVTDFGPISEAKIDLRPLTVFVGPSNTGKSWMAILIYALHRYFGGEEGPSHRRMRRSPRMFEKLEETLTREKVDALLTWVKREFGDRERPRDLFENSQKVSDKKPFIIPKLIADPVRAIFNTQGKPLGLEIRRCFGTDNIDGLIRKASRVGAHIAIRRRLSNDSPPFEHRLTIKSQEAGFRTTVPEGTEIQMNYYELYHEFDRLLHIKHDRVYDKADAESRFLCWRLIETIADLILPHLFGPLHLPAFYLPADRTGVMHAHSVVVSALFESATMTGLRPAARTPMLSGVLADFLEQLIEIDRPLHRRGKSRGKPRYNHAERIEDAILGGSVRASRAETTGYPRFTYQPEGWKDDLPLMNASSMVSELAPVVLYLRHMVRPGNVLIVEEPESHLHPGMQVEFIRQLAMLVQSGIRVIITTHSEWVLEELANTVRRSGLSPSDRKKTTGDDVALRPDQVGAWLFKKKNRPKGSVVEEVKLDDETGLYPADYDVVSESLYNESVNIFNRIQDSKLK